MDIRKGITFDEFIILRQKDFPEATGELSKILRDIALAAKIINREVNKAGLVDILGAAGTENVQGEAVQKLDIFANDTLKNYLAAGGQCCAIASEEEDDFVSLESEICEDARYVVAFDPLDGSSNIDVNVSIGTIFSIYRRKSTGSPDKGDFLQKGRELVAAGYVIYGSSTMLVHSTGHGVHGFTLDPSIGEFCLSHPFIQTPAQGSTYSINQGNARSLDEGIQGYLDYCASTETAKGKAYSLRYIGSMVADFHRNLIKGGIFLYPATATAPNGKLRLLYECNPLSFIVEQAGGKASTGTMDVLDTPLNELHQRVPIFIGSADMVDEALSVIGARERVSG